MADLAPAPSTPASSLTPRRVAIVLALVLLALGAVGAGCSSTEDASTTTDPPSPSELVGPDAFAREIDRPGVVTINVHTPPEGDIAGTDLVVPFDQITTTDQLPADTSTPLAIYCRSGNMSATAAKDLARMGYTDVVELDGGFNAWVDSGRSLAPLP